MLTQRFYGAVSIDGMIYRTKTTIKEKRTLENKPYTYKVTKVNLVISGSNTSNALKSLTSVETAKLLQNLNKPKENLFEAKFLIYNKQGYLH